MKKIKLLLVGLIVGLVSIQMAVTSSSDPSYDPWLDLNEDGINDVNDLYILASIYGTSGTPINKTELLLELQARVDSLNASLLNDYYNKIESDLIFVDASGDTITGYLDVDSGTLYVDDVNDRVGIGTSSPSGNLEIESSSVWPSIYLDNQKTGDMTTFIRFQEGGATQWGIGTDVAADGSDNFWIYDYTSGGTRLLIDTDGNVGIGASTPSKKLTVNGDAKVAGQFIPEGGIVNSGAITIESTANMVKVTAGGSTITIDSTGKITINSNMDVDINSSGTLNLSGNNVKITADVAVDIDAPTVYVDAGVLLDMVGGTITLNGPGSPAARMGDVVVVGDGVGTIVEGSPTVMIGPDAGAQDGLYLESLKSGKVYGFVLQEVGSGNLLELGSGHFSITEGITGFVIALGVVFGVTRYRAREKKEEIDPQQTKLSQWQ